FALTPMALAQQSASSAEPADSTPAQAGSSSTSSSDPATGAAVPSYGALADLLENERSRQALIEQLRELAGETTGDTSSAEGQAAGPVAERPGAGGGAAADQRDEDPLRGTAGALQGFAAGLAQDFSQTAVMLRGLFAGDGIHGMTAEQWRSRLLNLALVIAATLLAFGVFRMIAGLFFRRLDAWVQRSQPIQPDTEYGAHATGRHKHIRLTPRVGAILGALAIDAGAILLAALLGYVLALFIQEQWRTSIMLALIFVSAFVAIELARSLCRAVFSERHPHLRLWHMDNESAQYWSQWLQRIISITGYGMLVAVPVLYQML